MSYLLLLATSEDDHTTVQRLSQELPTWINRCALQLRSRDMDGRAADVSNRECGLVLQFVYDAVARAQSAGKQNIHGTWRKLLGDSYLRRQSGAKPAEFLASSADARHIAQGLVDGSMDWEQFAAALAGIGVQLREVSGESVAEYQVQSLQHFED